MMLSRFDTLDGSAPAYADRIPVFLVMADNDGGVTAGYHGTTVLAQMLRGLWPSLAEKCKDALRVESVAINDPESFRSAIERWNTPPYKTAGFCHELIMMNYSGTRLDQAYLTGAYRLCRETDTPVLCDEIQSSAWYDTLFLFRKYGLQPDFVSIGKGLPRRPVSGQPPAGQRRVRLPEPVRRARHQRTGRAGKPCVSRHDGICQP